MLQLARTTPQLRMRQRLQLDTLATTRALGNLTPRRARWADLVPRNHAVLIRSTNLLQILCTAVGSNNNNNNNNASGPPPNPVTP